MGKAGCGARIVHPKHSLGRRSWLLYHKRVREFGRRCAIQDRGFSKWRAAIHFSTVPKPNGANRDGAAARIHQILSPIARLARGTASNLSWPLDFSVQNNAMDHLLARKSVRKILLMTSVQLRCNKKG